MDKPEKIYDRADLLKVFNNRDGCAAGTFAAEVAIERRGELPLPPEIRVNPYQVDAPTEAYWSEGLRLLLVVQSVTVSDGGLYRLPYDHFLRDKDFLPVVKHLRAGSSAEIVEKCLKLAQEWRAIVRESLPEYTVRVGSQTKPKEEEPVPSSGIRISLEKATAALKAYNERHGLDGPVPKATEPEATQEEA